MTKRVTLLLWRAFFAGGLIIFTFCHAATGKEPTPSSRLVTLAAGQFPNLTKAERAMLAFADLKNRAHGDFAAASPSSVPDDPTNDPAHADQWDAQRNIRAALTEWLCTDPDAIRLVSPRGIRILGARIIGSLNLSYLRVPFPIVARKCVIRERIHLVGTEIPHLDLNGSYINEIDGKGLVVHSDLNMGDGFHSSGEILIETAKIDGDLYLGGAHLHHSAVEMSSWGAPFKIALDAVGATVGGTARLSWGFESDGDVVFSSASLNQGLEMYGARLSNPNNIALYAASAVISGGVTLGGIEQRLGGFEADGRVDFTLARVKSFFTVAHARFKGAAAENPALFAFAAGHGLFAGGMTVDGPLILTDVKFENGAVVDLTGAKVVGLLDEEKNWPEPGRLVIDSFTYEAFGPGAPTDVATRLRWICLEAPGFHAPLYTELAATYRKAGFDEQATEVLIAEEDARYSQSGTTGQLWGTFLKWTIAYGHRPLRAIVWSVAVVLLGWAVIGSAKGAGVMRPTYPENAPPLESRYQLLHPLLYSLDVFLPFVNLHQEHYWWPDAEASGECNILKQTFGVRGSFVQYYLWLQIVAGWLLSAIFIAGVTGLIRND